MHATCWRPVPHAEGAVRATLGLPLKRGLDEVQLKLEYSSQVGLCAWATGETGPPPSLVACRASKVQE